MSCVRTNGKLSGELPRFFDPYLVWAESDGSVRPGVGPCRGRGGGTPETGAGAVLRLFEGGARHDAGRIGTRHQGSVPFYGVQVFPMLPNVYSEHLLWADCTAIVSRYTGRKAQLCMEKGSDCPMYAVQITYIHNSGNWLPIPRRRITFGREVKMEIRI